MRTELHRTLVVKRLMRASFVVPLEPPLNVVPRVRKALKLMLPDAFFLQAPEKPFNDAILLRRIGGDEFLVQPVAPTGEPETVTLEDEPIVAPEDRRAAGPQGPKARQAGGLDGPLRLFRSPAQRKLIAN